MVDTKLIIVIVSVAVIVPISAFIVYKLVKKKNYLVMSKDFFPKTGPESQEIID